MPLRAARRGRWPFPPCRWFTIKSARPHSPFPEPIARAVRRRGQQTSSAFCMSDARAHTARCAVCARQVTAFASGSV
eukprot:2211313-Prymnesium_polylepis.3